MGVVVTCNNGLGVIVERAMYWDIEGVEWGGGHNTLAMSELSTTWYIAEGATEGFDQFVLIINPSNETAVGTVSFMINDGSVVEHDIVIGPTTRLTIHVNDFVPDSHLSTKIEITNGVPVAAEGVMYWDVGGIHWAGGHCSHGVTEPATTWYLAEGSTQLGTNGVNFETFILIQNPNDETANVDVTFMKSDGSTVERTFMMDPTSRYTIWLNTITELEDNAISTKVESNIPIIASRSMYGDAGTLEWAFGHSSVGVTSTDDTWYLAEGATLGNFDMWVLIMNPNSQDALVQVTFMTEDGSTETETVKVEATSRHTIWVNYVIPDEAVSVEVVSLNGVDVIVDRAMYWSANDAGVSSLSDFDVKEDSWIGAHSTTGVN